VSIHRAPLNADLHCHSSVSDGTLSPEALAARAKANGVQLAGHVRIDDRAILSGLSAVHQFVRIGRHAFVGGCSRVSKDIPPFLKAVGNPVKLYGLNTVGLQRAGFEEATLRELKRAYRLFFNSDLNITQALERAEADLDQLPEVKELVRFLEASGRGVVV